jgi:CRISPR/Cas system CMR-associated protein Cmr1 (group 7 of RAMP superfamily)
MRRFRQEVGVGRKTSANPPRPGLSRWPEPYSIRALWTNVDPAHNAQTHPAQSYYPRADLGLPINFGQLGSPPFPVLRGTQEGAMRMASPVIVKALALTEDRFVPLALVLNAAHLWDPGAPGVELKRQGVAAHQQDIAPDQMRMPPNALQPDPRRLTASTQTVRDAFVAWAEHSDGWGATAVQLP